ncbi:hypothetical protein [Hyphomicrobium sp. 2TAF46]|uniref:hypothetical protein n=1 Tax=Hyphomicrobium sp. 2TAF46 TaxID=3233019 RepID=UPI003F92B745
MSDTNEQPNAVANALQQARTGLHDATLHLERTLYTLGYDAGFNAGWDAAWRRFTAALQEQQPPPPEQPAKNPEPPPPQPQIEKRSAKEIVWQIVNETPGLRGVEIVDAARKVDPSILERTVRTALHRLKTEDEEILNTDGRWYPVI